MEACELRTCALLVHSGDFEDDPVFKVFAYQEGLSDTASAVDSEQFRIFRGQNAIQDELFRYTADDGLTFGQFRIPLLFECLEEAAAQDTFGEVYSKYLAKSSI